MYLYYCIYLPIAHIYVSILLYIHLPILHSWISSLNSLVHSSPPTSLPRWSKPSSGSREDFQALHANKRLFPVGLIPDSGPTRNAHAYEIANVE